METDPTSTSITLPKPKKQVTSLEIPCLVRNVDKAIEMLGGSPKIADAVTNNSGKLLGLSFCPDDPLARTIMSFNTTSSNVLLRFNVPKRIGKRKRGSDDPFSPLAAEEKVDARYLLRSLKDRRGDVQARALGDIVSTHVWRAMPDNAYSVDPASGMEDLRSKLFSGRYEVLRGVDFDKKGPMNAEETLPPPVLSTASLPYTYNYRQTGSIKEAGS